jgi:hypothetical protein
MPSVVDDVAEVIVIAAIIPQSAVLCYQLMCIIISQAFVAAG